MISKAQATWNFTSVGINEALRRLTRGVSDFDWRGICIAHLDTGIRDHPAFGGLDSDHSWVRLRDGVNFVEQGQPPIEPPHAESRRSGSRLLDFIADISKKDVDGHGTRIASVICGEWRGRPALTRVGLVPGLPLVPYRITDTVLLVEKLALQNLAEAIRHAVACECPVINISLGWPLMDAPDVERALDHAYEHGVLVIAAGGQMVDKVTYPAKFRHTIGVGGHKPNGRIWADYSETQYRFIDVWAPASRIVRARPERAVGSWMLDTLGGMGTSYGAAHVSVAAALWLRWHGENLLQAAYPEPWQRVEAFRTLLRTASTPLIVPRAKRGKIKTGRLKIDKLLAAALPSRHTLIKRDPLVGSTPD